jgi:hypothetical protein
MKIQSPFNPKLLLCVLLLALAIRLPAVLFSQGFIHSDDHFDTVSVAWSWLNGGLWGDDGNLRWKHEGSETIGRFPLYTLFLLALMKLCHWVGVTSLNSMMYFIRFVHALISLLPVWAAFRIVQQTTRSERWAVAAGGVIALHFAFPFLGVRTLIEVVGGSLWIAAVWFLYRYLGDSKTRWLYLAGLLTGLAWMVRFQIALAVIPVPFVLWWETRSIKPALKYSLAVVVMLLLSGLVDWFLLGKFAGSTITYLIMNVDLPALYRTIPLLYVALLIILLVPPLSLVALYLMFKPVFIRQHKILFWSSLFFVVVQSLHANQQERFIFPILPAFVVMGVLAIWHFRQDKPAATGWPAWFKWTAAASGGINVALLIFFTFAYGHKGMIEPLKWLEKNAPTARVLFFQPEVWRWAPVEYAGTGITPTYVKGWKDVAKLPVRADGETLFDYVIVYPKTDSSLPAYLDTLSNHLGLIEPVMQVSPSCYDQTLHRLNPGHNDNFEAHVFRPVPALEQGVSSSAQ